MILNIFNSLKADYNEVVDALLRTKKYSIVLN